MEFIGPKDNPKAKKKWKRHAHIDSCVRALTLIRVASPITPWRDCCPALKKWGLRQVQAKMSRTPAFHTGIKIAAR